MNVLAVAMFGVGLGAVLMAWDGITSGSAQQAVRDGALGAVIGGVAGAVGGGVAELLFDALLDDLGSSSPRGDVETRLRIARVLAWAVFGALTGLGLGIRGGQRRIVNGLIGGALGGAVGGFLFQQIELSSDSGSGIGIRFAGFVATGLGIGLGIGIVERLRRDVWLLITAGPMAGKEFILYKDVTMIGSSPKNDVVLAKDGQAAPQHLALHRDPSGGVTAVAQSGIPIQVNGRPVMNQRLRDGDAISLGMTGLSFQERAAAG